MSTMETTKNATEIDLDQEEVYVDGRRFTNADAEALADELEAAPPVTRGRGQPSLTGRNEVSPQVAARVPREVRDKLEARAAREGKRLSDVVRDALEAYPA